MAGSTNVRVNPAQLRQFLASENGPLWRDIDRRTNRVLNAARRNCPVDEGRLRASITKEIRLVNGRPVGRVGTNVEYAIWVHEGTGIYAGKGPITPKKARVLAWPVKNNTGRGRRRYKAGATAQYAFARRVRGVKGRPFLRDALKAAQ